MQDKRRSSGSGGKRVVRGSSVVAEYDKNGRRSSSVSRSRRSAASSRSSAARRPSSTRGSAAARNSRRGKKRMSRGKKVLIALGAVIVALALIIFFLFQYYFGGLKIKPIGEDADLGIDSSIERDDSITNILLCGVDTRSKTKVKGRSDALMMLTLDNKHDKIKIVSIPRDTLVNIDGYGQTKINHAYMYGGPELAIKTFNQTFHTDIKDYVSVNFYQLAEIIDAAGGVDIEVSAGEIKHINKLVMETTGDESNMIDTSLADTTVHMNGAQAVSFSRIRYLGTDDARTERQREVLTELFKTAVEMDFSKYPGFAKELLPMCETSLDYAKILKLSTIMLADDLQLELAAFPNEYIDISQSGQNTVKQDGVWYYVYDLEQAAEMIHKFVYDDLTFEQQYAPDTDVSSSSAAAA